MSESTQQSGGTGPSHRGVEIALAALMTAFGAIIMYGSWQVGIGWAFDGPRTGFFPFYLGIIIVVSSLINLTTVVMKHADARRFADWNQLRRVASVLVPAIVYVAIIPTIGIYVSSALLVGLFMKWLGRYSWRLTLIVAIGLPVAIFIVFERQFLIPLPKGPVEEWLLY